MTNPIVRSFWHDQSGSLQSVLDDPMRMKGSIIDPVWNYDALSDETQLYFWYDYAPGGHNAACMATVAEHKAANIHLRDGPPAAEYCKVRDARDASPPLPQLMLVALRSTIRSGRKPKSEDNGRSYLELQLDYFDPR